MIYKISQLKLQCTNNTRHVQGCSFCIFTIPCHCALITNEDHFSSHVSSCNDKPTNFTKLHPVNLALLQHFFDESRLSHILGNTTFSNPVNIFLPNFTIYKNKMDHIVASDQRSHLSLKKMAARVKQQNIIYSSLAESMLDGEIKIDDNYWSLTNNIISIIAITTTFVNAILIFWLFYKFRILAAAIILYKPVKTAPTTTLMFEYVPATTPIPNYWINTLSDNLKWDHGIFVLVLIILILLIVLLYKRISCRNMHTTLCLQISDGFQCVMIPIMHLPLCPRYWEINYPNIIDNIKINGRFNPKLSVYWPDFIVRNLNTAQIQSIPSILKLTIFQAWTLKSILKHPFDAYVILVHHNIQHPLKNHRIITSSPQQTPRSNNFNLPPNLYT